jgi:hypothetical protein
LRNRKWLENDYTSFSERFGLICKENLGRDFAKVVAKWDDALEPLNAPDTPQAARG